jgi:NhaP-type Na+/H+ or K+/H+ antiporter
VKLGATALVLLAAIGAVVAVVAGDSTAANVVSIVLIGSAAVGAVSLAFLAIGRAEDRDRQEAEQRAAEREPGGQSENGKPPEDPHPRTLGLGPDRRRPRPPRRPQ